MSAVNLGTPLSEILAARRAGGCASARTRIAAHAAPEPEQGARDLDDPGRTPQQDPEGAPDRDRPVGAAPSSDAASPASPAEPPAPPAAPRGGGCGAPPAGPSGAPSPDGRRLLRVEARNAETPIERKPEWIKTRARQGPHYRDLQSLVKREELHTVCQEAGCPNIYECWEDREATFLIGGSICTRRCDFCLISSGKPLPLDRDEPRRVAESVRTMGLRYATITGVTRDDLPDTGAWLYAETIRQIHALNPGSGVEVLADDLGGRPEDLAQVFEAAPQVFAHNLETVPRIFKRIRPGFRYERSLDVISLARDAGMVTKSNLILGMGEERAEILSTMRDLRDAGCDILTLTQYLRPSKLHHPIDRWVRPEEFVELKREADALGFAGVLAGPLVRSSYRAGRLWAQTMLAKGREVPEPLRHLTEAAPFPQAVSS